jgi:hypothetical protein
MCNEEQQALDFFLSEYGEGQGSHFVRQAQGGIVAFIAIQNLV